MRINTRFKRRRDRRRIDATGPSHLPRPNRTNESTTSKSLSSPTSTCRFLTLPFELRCMIYRYCFDDCRPKIIEVHYGEFDEPTYILRGKTSPSALLRTCRTIHTEIISTPAVTSQVLTYQFCPDCYSEHEIELDEATLSPLGRIHTLRIQGRHQGHRIPSGLYEACRSLRVIEIGDTSIGKERVGYPGLKNILLHGAADVSAVTCAGLIYAGCYDFLAQIRNLVESEGSGTDRLSKISVVFEKRFGFVPEGGLPKGQMTYKVAAKLGIRHDDVLRTTHYRVIERRYWYKNKEQIVRLASLLDI